MDTVSPAEEQDGAQRWSFEQNKRFEQALALYCSADDPDQEGQEDVATRGRWMKIAAMVPPGNKSAEEVRAHYAMLLHDVSSIEAGRIPLPPYTYTPSQAVNGSSPPQVVLNGPPTKAFPNKPASEQERKKGIPWTEEEHRLFLRGLDQFGKGDWRSISRNLVVSRTPTQVASHAQKYFIRLNSMNHKDKRRSSIHDITTATCGVESMPINVSATSRPPLYPTPMPRQQLPTRPITSLYPVHHVHH